MTLIGRYTDPDSALCIDCFDGFGGSTYAEITEDTEADTPTHCAHCEMLIQHRLTEDGLEYVADKVEEHLQAKYTYGAMSQPGRACILRQWWEAYGDLVFEVRWHDDLLKHLITDYFLSVPTVDKHSPVFARQVAKVHGMFPNRWCVVDYVKKEVYGPFVSTLAAGTLAGAILREGRKAETYWHVEPQEK
jgi:hypothetical protein